MVHKLELRASGHQGLLALKGNKCVKKRQLHLKYTVDQLKPRISFPTVILAGGRCMIEGTRPNLSPSLPLPGSRQFCGLRRRGGGGLRGLGRWLEEGVGEQSDEGLRYHRVHGEQPLLHAIELLEVGPWQLGAKDRWRRGSPCGRQWEGQELAPQQGWHSGLQCFEVLEGVSGGVGGGCDWLSLSRDLVPRGFGGWARGRVSGACWRGLGLVGNWSLR